MRSNAPPAILFRALPLLIVATVLGLAAVAGTPVLASFRLPLLVLGVGGAALALLLGQPGLGLVALAALSFTVPFTVGTGSEVALTPPVMLIPVIAVAWLLEALRQKSLQLPRSRTMLPLFLFLLGGLLSLLAGRAYWDPLVPQPDNLVLVQLAQWGLYALSGAIFVLAGALGSQGRWLKVATWVFLILAGVVVMEYYLPPLRRALGWSSPIMASRSMFWTWLAALAGGQLIFNRSLRGLVRLGLLGLLLGAGYVVWFQMSDWVSGWVPFTVAAATVVWLRFWRGNRAMGVLAAVALVTLAVVLYPLLFVHAGGEQELQMSWGGRQHLYRTVIELANKHPILGLGPAAYRHYAVNQWLSLGAGNALYLRPAVSSHNNYIDIYAQMGLAGLVLFLWFLTELGLLGWRLAPRFRGDFEEGYVQGALAGLAGTLVAMMLADWFLPFVYNIGFPGFRTSALAWLFLGGLVALEQRVGDAKRGKAGEGETGRVKDGQTEGAVEGAQG